MYKAAHEMEKPIIAAINGYAVGAGLELALSCDIRVAADDAKMGEAFVRMGLMPEMSVYVLPRLIGMGKAKLMSFTGDAVTAQKAEQMGLVDMVVPSSEMLSAAQSLAKRLAEGPVAIGIIKKALNESLGMSMDMSLHYAMRMQYHLVHTEDHKEAVAAWMEKRQPVFKGK
jgi:enoyl-CoA hydratase/carnithine racemase